MSGVAPSARFYQHGWQSWSATGWRPVDRPVRHPLVEDHLRQATDPARIGGRPGGSAVGAIETGSGEVELLGALDLDGWVWLDDGRLTGDGAGEWFTFRGPESEALAAYARRLGDRFGTRRRESGPVWCSWYSFFRDISEPALLSVLSDLGTLPFSTFQIDDGWQRSNGDWQANAKFPSGMEAFADRIAIEGRTPGLWLAPFLADADSALVARFPQMLLRDEDGAPLVGARNWGGDTYVLDVGRDDVLEWVADLTLTVVGWGYHYLKLDFLYAPALPTSSVDERPREVLYRRALESIRAAAGDDIYLLACGAPIVASLGVCDAIRVGPDAAPFWDNLDRTLHLADRAGPGAADAITTSLGRYWLRDLIEIDPDVAYFRSKYCLLDKAQRRQTQRLADVCGFRATSDPPAWLESEELGELEVFLERRPAVRQMARYRFDVGGEDVDFTDVAESRPW